jgi:hypothetical protein
MRGGVVAAGTSRGLVLEGSLWLAGLALTGGLSYLLAQGAEEAGTAVVAMLAFAAVAVLGRIIARPVDQGWLPKLIILGFLAKLVGSYARYYAITVIYRSGDAITYHKAGLELVKVWRSLSIPSGASPRGAGTQFVEVVTGLIYVPYVPTVIGGFLIFATIAFLGQILFYVAFRRAFPEARLKLYAVAMLFFPSMVFWPASIGKETLMTLFLGVFAIGVVDLTQRRFMRGVLLTAVSGALVLGVRSHMAVLAVGAAALGIVLAKAGVESGRISKVVIFLLLIGGGAFLLTRASDILGFSLTTEDIQEFADSVTEQTSQGGGQVNANPATNPLEVPGAVVRVLFRPLLTEVSSFEQMLSALEGTGLLLISLWKAPAIYRNRRLIRRSPYLSFCVVYTLAFVIAWSAVANYGILARQRVQVLPFYLAILVILGFPSERPVRSIPVLNRV